MAGRQYVGHDMMSYAQAAAGPAAAPASKLTRKEHYGQPQGGVVDEEGPDGVVRTFARGLRVTAMPEPEWNPERLVRGRLSADAPAHGRPQLRCAAAARSCVGIELLCV